MKKETVQSAIENAFRQRVKKDNKIKNAYLLIDSEKCGISLNLAEGRTGDFDAHPGQPNHLASVGKLFTAALAGLLHDQGKLSFDDLIADYLDEELMNGLHVFKGKEYSREIKIHHLLSQTSGLNDVFFPLLKKIIKDPGKRMTTKEAVIWGKQNLDPQCRPGEKHFYGDTNYYLLGIIIENITKMPFQKAMHQFIFDPLKMNYAYMNDSTKPKKQCPYPTAAAYIKNVDFTRIEGIAPLDHAGSSVIAPLEEYLIFMKALVNGQIVKKETLERMLSDDFPMGAAAPGIHYGYGIWKFKTVPVIMPEKFNCWGCAGVTGAFMFYHPKTESYVIGTFNDMSAKQNALRFMLSGVINKLLKCE